MARTLAFNCMVIRSRVDFVFSFPTDYSFNKNKGEKFASIGLVLGVHDCIWTHIWYRFSYVSLRIHSRQSYRICSWNVFSASFSKDKKLNPAQFGAPRICVICSFSRMVKLVSGCRRICLRVLFPCISTFC